MAKINFSSKSDSGHAQILITNVNVFKEGSSGFQDSSQGIYKAENYPTAFYLGNVLRQRQQAL